MSAWFICFEALQFILYIIKYSMQNLETKFPATSPNIEYLGQFHLLD